MTKETKSKKNRRYDAEFKSKILDLHANGRSISSLSQDFGIRANVIYRWRKQANNKDSLGQKSDYFLENKRLRKELSKTIIERDMRWSNFSGQF